MKYLSQLNFIKTKYFIAIPVGAAILATSYWANASTILQYDFQGQPGNETSVSSSFASPDISALAFTESGLTPASGANSINASGFTSSSAFYSFGFDITAGNTVTINQIVLDTRSSSTGPGFITLQDSVDGGSFSTLATITQTGTADNDEMLSIAPITGASSIVFRLTSANQTSAGGGAVGGAGTFRVADYAPTGTTPTAFSVNGSISTASVSAAPEPETWALLLAGVAMIGAMLRFGRRRATLSASAV